MDPAAIEQIVGMVIVKVRGAAKALLEDDSLMREKVGGVCGTSFAAK
jgi:hypothetical protein